MQLGILSAGLAYAIWGLFPMYFKVLQAVPPTQILAHRIIWSVVFLIIVLAARRQWRWIKEISNQPKIFAAFAASAVLLSVNWLIYVWAVNQGRVVDASLGYFINPLVSVLFGLLILRERLRALQWVAIGLATLGVAWLTWQTHQVPWVALALATTFGTYGLLRKIASLGALEGLALETMLMFPLAAIFLTWLSSQELNVFPYVPLATQWLLAAAGPITAIPLLLFASGARLIPLSLLGILQYIAPTLQLLLGVWLYREPFGQAKLVGFAFIWGALLIYSIEGAWHAWARNPEPTPPA